MEQEYKLPDDYSNFIATSRYARWIDDLNRREQWPEQPRRYVENVVRKKLEEAGLTKGLVDATVERCFEGIASRRVMPSMRGMMVAGKALDRDNASIFNCSFLAVDSPRAFDEALYLLACGVGVGYSVERQFVNELPTVSEEFFPSDTNIVVGDSKIGWASALRELISLLYSGKIPKIDVSKVRPAGAKLKVFGGRSSGPEPLVDLFKYCIRTFQGAAGRKLTSLECHGIVCKIGETIVVGGVRRSACISLSNLTDQRMRNAKSGQWWEQHPEYRLANNSVAYTEKPDVGIFMEEWLSLYQSKSGERGIFNRQGVQKKIKKAGLRDPEAQYGTNPCGEISLKPCSFCNLSTVIVRADDTFETLKEKVEIAAILGTIQSTFTNFQYLRKIWKKNAEEERLLGVSLCGIYDSKLLNGSTEGLEELLDKLNAHVAATNKIWAEKLDIPCSVSWTAIKPEGTTSQLCDAASGIHPRHAKFYIRRIRGDNKDPLTQFMIAQGIPSEACVFSPETTTVFSFPMKAPEGAIVKDEVSALDHLNLWKVYNQHWATHQVSVTVSLKENEWMEAGAWVYKNFDEITGISFLPEDQGTYRQAPYETISQEQYDEMLKAMPTSIDWGKLADFEKEDTTKATQELACVGGVCSID